eukprot:6481406-Amphidinium_carterae.1
MTSFWLDSDCPNVFNKAAWTPLPIPSECKLDPDLANKAALSLLSEDLGYGALKSTLSVRPCAAHGCCCQRET